jgi:hypothetical protein
MDGDFDNLSWDFNKKSVDYRALNPKNKCGMCGEEFPSRDSMLKHCLNGNCRNAPTNIW